MVEQAQRDGTIKCGAVFDIIKPYNTFPRKPLLRFMLRLGVPFHFVRAYDTFLRASGRRLLLAGHTGEEIPSITGIPEGCTFAVFGMMVLSALYIHVGQKALPMLKTGQW